MLGVVLGTALQLQQSSLWPLWGYAAISLGVAVLAGWLWLRPGRSPAWLVLLVALAWAGASTGWRAVVFQSTALSAALEGVDVRVQGVVHSMPQPAERGVRLHFQIEQAWASGQPVQLPPKVVLTWYGALPAQGLQAGQRWAWTVRLKAPHGVRNPHGMDWELWLWSQGIQATGYVRVGKGMAAPQWLGQTWQAPLAQWRGQVHRAMQAPAQAAPREQASWGVLQALVTGAQSSISRSDWQLFRDTGVAHLVSISGLHITMFAWLAMAVVNALWRRSMRLCLRCPAPLAAAWAGWGLALLYALFSGWGVPAQRTIGMLLVVVLLRSQGRTWPWPVVWLAVLAAVVLLDPWCLWQAGFWLSFVAVAVLFATQAQGSEGQLPRKRWGAGRRLLHEQGVLCLALAPLTLLLFGHISLLGMLANLWAIPWVTLLVTPLSMLGVLWPALWPWAAQAVTAMVVVLEYLVQGPLAVLYFAQPPTWAALAGVLGCGWWVMPWGWRVRSLALPWVLPMLCWQPAAPPWGEFELWALDVGQGSAVLLRTQQHSLLFDAGPRWSAHADAGERVVVPVLRALGVRLTALMVSHADSDHAGGAQSVQQAFPHAQWWGAGGQPCQQGRWWQWDGVHLQVLHPPQAVADTAGHRNASSCVLKLRSASGHTALLTGDMEAAQEQALLQAGQDVQADWLQVPHHGSATSSTAAWIAAVQPTWAVVQAGYRNRFGHPVPQVVARYQAAGAQVVETAGCGAVWWRSWQPQQLQCERLLRPRYWARPSTPSRAVLLH